MLDSELNQFKLHRVKLEQEILKKYDIIVSTVDSLSDHRVMGATKQLGVTTLIIDEAAQLKQPSFLFLLKFRPKRVIVVGDHQQLRPQVDSYAAASAGLEKSLMEWLKLG